MKSLVALSLLLVLSFSLAKEEKIFKPQEWDLVGPISSPHNHKVEFTIAVTQQNKYKLEELFWAVSDPKSAQYGQYLSLDELTTLIAPEQQSLDKIESWLADHDVVGCKKATTRDFLHCEARVEKVEEMLNTKFFEFVHSQNKDKKVIRALSYRLPTEIAPHVDYIGGVIGFPVEHKAKRLSLAEMQVQGVFPIGPKELRQRYQVPSNLIGTQSNNSQAVAEFQAQYYSPSDLSTFFKKYVSNSQASSVYKVVGTNDPSNPGVEANLDIQYIMGVAPGVNTWFWSNPNFDFWSDLTNWLSQISSTQNPPLVHSISYGSQGNYPSESYRTRLDTEFQKLGVRGLSIIFASGDSGTGCSFCTKFQPSFPATSVYVTSVGATQFINNQVGPERAVESFGSGGGFSLFFPRPAYQNDSVNHYFQTETDLPESFFYNKNGRGTPDVAALGIGFSVLVNGQVDSVGGTSASAPTFAGIVSLLNDIRLKNKKAPLGFLNPFIYQTFASHPEAFFDVTEGNNKHGCCGLTGFKAAPGWDPVTGVGTPNFAVLSKLV